MSQATHFADRLSRAATEATAEELSRDEGWWPFRRRTKFRPDLGERERAKRIATAAVQRKLAETGSYPSQAWLAEHVRTQMGVKQETKSALWIILFVARLLMLLSMFAEDPKR